NTDLGSTQRFETSEEGWTPRHADPPFAKDSRRESSRSTTRLDRPRRGYPGSGFPRARRGRTARNGEARPTDPRHARATVHSGSDRPVRPVRAPGRVGGTVLVKPERPGLVRLEPEPGRRPGPRPVRRAVLPLPVL